MKNETIAQINGNELVWLLTDISSLEQLEARRIQVNNQFKESWEKSKNNEVVKFYSGFAYFKGSQITCNELLQKAEMIIEHAKVNKIPNPVMYDESFKIEIENNEKLKSMVFDALKKELFTLVYQEQVNSDTGEVVGVEALARLVDDQYRLVSPTVFIPIIEREKKAIKFGKLIIRKVLGDYTKLFSHYSSLKEVSINVSPTHILSAGFTEFIISEVTRRGINPTTIMLEITEGVLVEELEVLNEILRSLRLFGVKIALDDFGTGYASLNYLSNLELDQLKIDKSFIDLIGKKTKIEGTIKAILQIADEHKYAVIAEGVENYEQCNYLKKVGCIFIQGYLYSKPTPLDVIINGRNEVYHHEN